jgi:thiosulfate/3-mercaptopyruvate sulfurtransferase
MMKRSLVLVATLAAVMLAQTPSDPWTPSQLLEPKELAAATPSDAPEIVMVGPRVLYDGAHIVGALYAGPATKPEGIQKLLDAAANLPKDAPIVIYCGCCPMTRCPNIRPAFTALHDAGFKNVKVLALKESMHADWTDKGYPVQKGS